MKTAYVIDPRYREHNATANHPEGPERIQALLELIKGYQRDGLVRVEPRRATREELLMNHAPALVEAVAATSGKEPHVFDADTATSAATYETARLATGGLLNVLDATMEGTADNGFALVRPPGHHAEADRAMGFCFFNSVAIGARYLKKRYNLDRILIMDWDVHHGNGTQRSFYAVPDVLFVSTHQYPHYPGTGALTDVGLADGLGRTVNLPFPAGFGDAEYANAFRHIVEPIAHEFQPQFVLISAGFDCHRYDPLGDMEVSSHGFSMMAKSLLGIAEAHAGGRFAVVLEGGYSLDALKEGVASVLDVMGGREVAPLEGVGGEETIDAIRKIQKRFWKL